MKQYKIQHLLQLPLKELKERQEELDKEITNLQQFVNIVKKLTDKIKENDQYNTRN